jgi:hypothetical protein
MRTIIKHRQSFSDDPLPMSYTKYISLSGILRKTLPYFSLSKSNGKVQLQNAAKFTEFDR